MAEGDGTVCVRPRVYVCACARMCMQAHMCACVCACMCVCTRMYACVCTRMCVCAGTRLCVCECACAYMCVRVYVHACACVCVCVCVCVWRKHTRVCQMHWDLNLIFPAHCLALYRSLTTSVLGGMTGFPQGARLLVRFCCPRGLS